MKQYIISLRLYPKSSFCLYSLLWLGLLLAAVMKVDAQPGMGRLNEDASLFYYFGNQKIYLTSSVSNIYVEMSSAGEATKLNANMQSRSKGKGTRMQPLAMANRLLVALPDAADFDSSIAWLKRQSGVVVARPAVHTRGGKDQLYEESFYVKLKPTTTEQMLRREAAGSGCVILKQYDHDNKVFLIGAGAKAGFDGLQMANRFYETGLFEFSEPDFRPLDLLFQAPNDPLYNLQWALTNTGSAAQFNGVPGADIGIENAWVLTKGSPTIRIAVIDEGVERTHPDLVNNIDPLGFGLVAANAATGSILASGRSHGTSCAGIIAAQADNGIGVAGIAPMCKIIPVNLTVNTSGSFGTASQLATCIDWAWNQGGADILSNSWGGGTPSTLVHEAIKRATTLGRGGKGAIVLFSSGNDDAGVASPAIFPETIAVGAMDMCYQRKSINTCDAENFWGSNYGTGLDIAAPGVKIATTANGGYNETFNGTSSACPMVAGVAALVLSANSNLTQLQVRQILERTARKVGAYSYGRVAGQPNGSWSSQLGHGMVNAQNAVYAAQGFDFDCQVSISADGPTQVCGFGSVTLRVNNVVSGTYTWLRNGQSLSSGQTIFATSSGSYQAVIQRPSGCRDTSVAIEVRIPPQLAEGVLVARAGKDTTVCSSTVHIMGGGPSAFGGTAMHHPLRGMVHDGFSNNFFRFDPNNPSQFFKLIKAAFNPDGVVYCGAASTPFGLFMLAANNKLVKVDTATGQVLTIGSTAPQAGSWRSMTYHPQLGKVFGMAYTGAINQLYEIDIRTGSPSLIGTIANVAGIELSWLAAHANGDLYAMNVSKTTNAGIYKFGLNPLAATPLPSSLGFQAFYEQDAAFDPITGKLLFVATTRPLGSGRDFPGAGLWEANTATGEATLIGSVAQPYYWLDGLSLASPEYKYSWSPSTYLSNPNDANPIFTGAPAGSYTYTLTVTDLCGYTAQSSVTITVKPGGITPNANGVLFVNAAATGNNTGSSWGNAVKSLQQAIQLSCSDVKQIWVARGTYTPTNSSNRDSAFSMRNNLAIYGGFAGNEASLSQRNLRLNQTILSGDIGVAGIRTDNSYNVIANDNNGLNASAILDGFIITNGYANKFEYARSRGGGMYNFNCSPLIRNCVFAGNYAMEYGGGVFNQWPTATPTFVNCVFSGNQALFGGGVYNESAQTRIINCTFSANQVANTGGAMYSYGQALATVRNSIVWGNTNGITTAAIDNSTPIEVTHSLVQGGYTGTGNLNADPVFVRQLSVGLGQWGDLRLQACSPAINTGSNAAVPAGISQDANSNTRFLSTTVDMGAYERASLAASATIYVNAAANGLNDGSSWANAYTSLAAALSEINTCNAAVTLNIAAGTYTMPPGFNFTFNRADLQVLGGFPNGGGTRNAAQHPVYLKGETRVLKSLKMDGVVVQPL